jgi:hypothetical protein
MRIELLYCDGCPSHAPLLGRLRELLAAAGVDAPVEERRVESEADAISERFLGSPTLRIDGVDVDPAAAERKDFGLTCRLYRTDAGLRGAPPDEWIVDAVERAAAVLNPEGPVARKLAQADDARSTLTRPIRRAEARRRQPRPV